MTDDSIRDRADRELVQAGPAVGADDDQITTEFLGQLGDLVAGLVQPHDHVFETLGEACSFCVSAQRRLGLALFLGELDQRFQ